MFYFSLGNLSGGCKNLIYDHTLQLSCSHYLPVDETQIPTGELRNVIVSASGDDDITTTYAGILNIVTMDTYIYIYICISISYMYNICLYLGYE